MYLYISIYIAVCFLAKKPSKNMPKSQQAASAFDVVLVEALLWPQLKAAIKQKLAKQKSFTNKLHTNTRVGHWYW